MTWVNDCIVCPGTYTDVLEECYVGYNGDCDGTKGLCKKGINRHLVEEASRVAETPAGSFVFVSAFLDLLQAYGYLGQSDRADMDFNDDRFLRLLRDFSKVLHALGGPSKG
jgi:hypothetical protein